MALIFKLIKSDSSILDFTADVVTKSISRDRPIFDVKSLAPKSGKLSFTVQQNSDFISYMMTTDEKTRIEVMDGLDYFFVGYITPSYSIKKSSTSLLLLDVDVDDMGKYAFERNWESIDGAYTDFSGFKVCDKTDTAHSFVHQVCALAGVSVDANIPTDDNIIPIFNVLDSDNIQYQDKISKLLFEYGYTFYFLPNGKFTLFSLLWDDISTTQAFNEQNIQLPLEIKKLWDANTGINIKYSTTEVKDRIRIHSDTTNGTDAHTCVIALPADGYYPEGATATSQSIVDWSDPDGGTILDVESIDTSEFSADGEIDITGENYGKNGVIKAHNHAASTRNI